MTLLTQLPNLKQPLLLTLLSVGIAYLSLFASISAANTASLDKLLNNNSAPELLSSPARSSSGILDDGKIIDLSSLSNEEAFLPVEEAYQLSVTHTHDGLALDWVIADEYFLYGEQFRFSINNQTVDATLPTGIVSYDPIFEKDVEKHYQHAKVTINSADLPKNPGFELSVVSQGCADAGLCYPPHTERFNVSADAIKPIIVAETPFTTTIASTKTPTRIAKSGSSTSNTEPTSVTKVLAMISFAIIGGIILNLMPCVLPVLSLKALSLANNDNNHRYQGWSYTLGVISTFMVIAGLLLSARTAGHAVGWGFQLQSPGFVTVLIYLFFIMGLSLSGCISIGARWMSAGQGLTHGSGPKQSYFTGVLAAVVASPCTAPFMASALGFAITQPWWLALSIFVALGFGMALPLLLLSYTPQLAQWLPKPGAWMDTLKQALAFPLYLTAIWLLWVLARQLGTDTAIVAMLGGLGIVFVFWLGNRVTFISPATGILSLILVVLLSWHNSKQPLAGQQGLADPNWEPYSEQRLDALRRQEKAVFINMTADWCITCIANEKVVFTDAMIGKMKSKGIHLLKGDWTNYDPAITRLLEKYKRGGVPLYVLFPAKSGSKGQVLPQILSPSGFKNSIESI